MCSGGSQCAGSGSTARNALDCGTFGCHSVDGTCSGGFCPGNGCTAKQTADCAAMGASCVDEKCAGGSAPGTGCTARQALDCSHLDAGCVRGACTTPSGPVLVDAGQPQRAPDDGGIAPGPDAGRFVEPEVDAGTQVEFIPADDAGMSLGSGDVAPLQNLEADPVTGGCSSVPGSFALVGLFFLALTRRRTTR